MKRLLLKSLAIAVLCALPSLAAKPDWKVSIAAVGAVKVNFSSAFNVTIKDAKGAPVEGAAVEVVLTMVEMDHGEFKSKANALKPGVYQAKPMFFMVGKWNMEVRARKGPDTLVQKFPYDVKE
ncbi:MAG: hypothetical protein EXQ52_19195 [Bryobacterales bacterium]|nr:hypothetical protein [Bryobacterales bacterium]